MDNIKAIIKQFREAKGFTHETMAQRLHMARSTYSKLESGKTGLNFELVINISKILDIPLNSIINDDPVYKSISDELSMMVSKTHNRLSDQLLSMIPYDKLTPEHKKLLKEKGFETKEAYESTPLRGRIYEFGSRDVLRILFENCGMDILFRRNLITDDYWVNRWSTYCKNGEKITMSFGENDKFIFNDKNGMEIDTHDYFVAYQAELKMTGNKERWIQFAERDFPACVDEWEALEYIKKKTSALEAEILCFTTDGFDPFAEIITPRILEMDTNKN
jgi:transcriptional regulator with XRE-family HTH domain